MKLLDTSAWVEYFKGSEKGRKVKLILAELPTYTSALTFAEISKWFADNHLPIEIGIKQIKINSIVLSIEEKVLIESGKRYALLRALKPKIGLIDTIIYVTARLHNLTLVTGDYDFKGLESVELV